MNKAGQQLRPISPSKKIFYFHGTVYFMISIFTILFMVIHFLIIFSTITVRQRKPKRFTQTSLSPIKIGRRYSYCVI